MFSGTGRHRRPRQAPAFVVTAGATTAGLALPLLGTGAAHATDRVAVDEAVWDEVAECESGGEWTADRGNGFYGGLQLPLTSWEEYGGEEFAERPDLASRAQQIAVAERILHEEGPRAFPACALGSGLTSEYRASHDVRDGAREGDDSGRDTSAPEETPEEDATSEEATERDDPPSPEERETGAGEREDDEGEPAEEERDSSDAGEADTERDGRTDGTGDSGTEPDDATPPAEDPAEDGAAEDGTDEAPDGTEDRGNAEQDRTAPGSTEDGANGGRHRGDAAPDDADRAGERGGGRHAVGRDDAPHEVAHGDSLSAIAADHRLPGGWPALYEANTTVVGDDPDHILPGQRLVLPAG